MKYVIGIDIGTSGTKTTLYDTLGNAIDFASIGYELIQKFEGYAEQNPEDWAFATEEGIRQIIQRNPQLVNHISGISYSGQMHGLVMLDKDNHVIRPSIIWCDQRTSHEVVEMNDVMDEKKWLEITGNIPGTGLTLSKLLWVRKNEPSLFSKIEKILLPKDYVRYTMTGVLATEVTDASGTQLFDLKKRTWSNEICNLFHLDINILPKVMESTDVAGYITEEFYHKTLLPFGVPVIAGAADQPASAIGNGVCNEETMCDTLGSSGVVFTQSSQYTFDSLGRTNTFCHAVPGTYAMMGVTQGCGLSVTWMMNQFYSHIDQPFNVLESELKNSSYNEKLVFLPYLMGERTPINNPFAKGVLFGITNQTERRDIARAVFEGISMSQLDAYTVFKEMNIVRESMILSGGGAKNSFWAQLMSDLFGLPVLRNLNPDTSSLGAAIIAAIGVHLFSDFEQAISSMVHYLKPLQSDATNMNLLTRKFNTYKQLYDATKKLM